LFWLLCFLLICTADEENSIRELRAPRLKLLEQEDSSPLPQAKIFPPFQAQTNNNNQFSLSNENDLLSQILKGQQKDDKSSLISQAEEETTNQHGSTVSTESRQSRLEENHDDDAPPQEEEKKINTPTPITKTAPTSPPSSTPASVVRATSTSPEQSNTTTTTTEDSTTQDIKSWLGWNEYLSLSYLAVTVITLGGCLLGCLLGCLCLRSGIGGPGKVEETSRVFDSDDDED